MASGFNPSESVRLVHATLRDEFRKGNVMMKIALLQRMVPGQRPGDKSAETIWEEHLTKKSLLVDYANSMHTLATVDWAKKHDNNRITWCVQTIRDYFHGGLEKVLKKDLRRIDHQMATIVDLIELPKTEQEVAKTVEYFVNNHFIKLLDVGSCYNPFVWFEDLEVLAVDIAPAVESVMYCDFLNATIASRSYEVPVSDSTSNWGTKQVLNRWNEVLAFEEQSFDVVVFCLLLSYFPHPKQRLKCCFNAHKILRLHGLLLVVIPDSSHQNKHAVMMKRWKAGIEGLGFCRWKYSKEEHLHCMAFRKVTNNTGDCVSDDLSIPQDSHEAEPLLLSQKPDMGSALQSTTSSNEYDSNAPIDIVNMFKCGQDNSS